MDELIQWLQVRITSSLRPRADDIKTLFGDPAYRICISEFLKNEDVHAVFIYSKRSKGALAASLTPPSTLQSKCLCFAKLGAVSKLTGDNIVYNVITVDCTKFPLRYIGQVLHQVYLPLLCLDNGISNNGTFSSDRIMDILHRFTGNLEVIAGHSEGSIVLPIPSLDILGNSSASDRRGAVIHTMETAVIGWIKQIKVVLKHDPFLELKSWSPKPGIYREKDMWKAHIHDLQSINEQLNSTEALEIFSNLEEANSTYAHSFKAVRKDINKALAEAEENQKYLERLVVWYDLLKSARSNVKKQTYFLPMLHTLLLVWTHSRYYHQPKVFVNLLKLMSNEVVHVAGSVIGDNVLKEPMAYASLKEALKICATFRGTYLDVKVKADDINSKKNEENINNISKKPTDTLWNVKMYGPLAAKFTWREWPPNKNKEGREKENDDEWLDSPWPLHSAKCFQHMNMFMERCNDVLDLLETMKHFQILETVVQIGGAGSPSLDARVEEIWDTYRRTKEIFISQTADIFTIDRNNPFEKAFFDFRIIIKDLEHQLAGILRISFQQCHTIGAQLRLLEVFEGISRREIIKDHVRDIDEQLVCMFIDELTQVKDMYMQLSETPPQHINTTPTVSKLTWIKALKARISQPMMKLRTVSPVSLEGDLGWKLRNLYGETLEEFVRYEDALVTSWLEAAKEELSDSIKLPLLATDEAKEECDDFFREIELNLNADLLLLLREARYLMKSPFQIQLKEPVQCTVRTVDINKLKVLSSHLETVVSKYNEVMRTIADYEMPLFDKKLTSITELLKEGLQVFTWNMEESADYIERLTSCICLDLHTNYNTVKNNYQVILDLTSAWYRRNLDIFSVRDLNKSYSISELVTEQKNLEEDLERQLLPDGQILHSLAQKSFEAVGISEASPAWQEYIQHIDMLVLQGLKKVTITSLASMLNTLLDCEHPPLLSVQVELIDSEVAFSPPLDQRAAQQSVLEHIEEWLKTFLLRRSLIRGLSSVAKDGFSDYTPADEESLQLVGYILEKVSSSMQDCQATLDVFGSYTFLWKQDVSATFHAFLHGKSSVKEAAAVLTPKAPPPEVMESIIDSSQNQQGGNMRSQSMLLIDAERAFIQPKDAPGKDSEGPLLEDFDLEISAYQVARDSIRNLPDIQDLGWIQVDFTPIKQVLSAYAFKWMWTFTKYLIDQMSHTLRSLDFFLKRTEPQVERITGEERDTGSFMKMMRLFNEVSAKQAEMDVQFTVMQKTVTLLEKYEMKLPAVSEILYKAMPGRWSNMKTKVSLAKQRLGPRIQQEAERVTKDLGQFQNKLDVLGNEIEKSEVYVMKCGTEKAFGLIGNFSKQVKSLQNEAKDLKELQELLETTVVDFSILDHCEDLVKNLSLLWQNVDVIQKEQDGWKKELWQDMDTEQLYKSTNQQQRMMHCLPNEVQEWEVYIGTLETIHIIQLTLPLIEDLSNPAMRTRHWKQLVRQTGGVLRVTAESLRSMTLGDLLALGLQRHTGHVKSIVQRAVRDVTIESALKNCEEVWLSKIFDLRPHCRVISAKGLNEDLASSVSGSQHTRGETSNKNATNAKTSRRMSRQSDKAFHLSKKGGRGSALSLYDSLKYMEELGAVMLLKNTDCIFEELENHQVVLATMQNYSETGSFLDEVIKWQKKLQVIETAVRLWLLVQEKWTQLEEVFSTLGVRMAMPKEAVLFADIHHNFSRLMKAAEENPNILQNCMRRGLQGTLEQMNHKLERCQRAVRLHLDQRRMAFPRFFFLSLEDTLNVVCYAYDPSRLNEFLMKMFEHIEKLIYEPMENPESAGYRVLGVRSFLAEELYLIQPLECKGPIESWLPRLVSGVKEALQHHLHATLGYTTPDPQRKRAIHSAGARRVVISGTQLSKEESAAHRKKSLTPSMKKDNASLGAGDREEAAAEQKARHWVLGTISEVAQLSSCIAFSNTLKCCLSGERQRRKDAMQDCLADLTGGIECAAKILNEIPQDDIQHAKRASKAGKEGERQDSLKSSSSCDINEDGSMPRDDEARLTQGGSLKLSNHILLLLYQRDVVQQLASKVESTPRLRSHLCHEYDENTMDILVKIGDAEFRYGYEYQGSADHVLITPLTERAFLNITAAVSCGVGAMCMGSEGVGKRSTVRELTLCLGMALFFFNCTKSMDHSILQDICKGLASAGAWICFNGLGQLQLSELTTLAQLLGQIQAAKFSGKETVSLQLDEIPLNPVGACISIIGSPPVSSTQPRMTDTASCSLPGSLLSNFRIVSISEVPASFILETLLLLRGFSSVALLARKLSVLLDVSSELFKTFPATSMRSQHGIRPGWSISSIKSLLSEASNLLKSIKQEDGLVQGVQQSGKADESWLHRLEDRAMMRAIHHCVLPQLSGDKMKLFQSLMAALWPEVISPTSCSVTSNVNTDTNWSLPAVKAPEDNLEQQVLLAPHTEETSFPPDIMKAVAAAAQKRRITPSNAFASNVSHLVQLASKSQTVALIGPAGCGKSECIKTYAETLRQTGRRANMHTVFIRALESRNLLGHMEPESGWVDGLLPTLLRKYSYQHESEAKSNVKIMHLDGEIDEQQMELMLNIFRGADVCVLENNERIKISSSLRIFWELDTLANVSPAVASRVAILPMTCTGGDWKLLLTSWIATHDEEPQQLLQHLTELFLVPTMQFLKKHWMTQQMPATTRIIPTEGNVIQTLFRIFQALSLTVAEMVAEDVKKYFLFSCIWAFGGTLESQQKTIFSRWWRKHFRNNCVFPGDGEIWDYYIDSESHQFVKWNENIMPYSIPHGQGIPSEAFVRTVHAEQVLYLSNLLSIAGWPIILLGNSGCGKTALMHEHINTLCSGDVAELLELKIATNRSTDTKMVWGCLKERLEWRNGSLYTPAGNKKLLCLLDDLHLAKVDHHGSPPACEFVRQLLDQGGIFDPFTHEWKTVNNIIYLATLACAALDERHPMPSQRLLRHFCILHCPYPSHKEQIGIFSTMLNGHFLQPVTDNKIASLIASTNDLLQDLLLAITTISVELQERMRTVYLGTSVRCHYIFTLRDLSKIFRNICLSLDGSTTPEKLLYLWRHECDWVYGHRMVSLVDYSRYEQEFAIAAKKVFANEEQLQLILSQSQPLFSNIIEDEGGLITTSSRQQEFNSVKRHEKAGNQLPTLDGYQPTFDMSSAQKLLTEAVREYNKANPRMSITFFKNTVEHLCRLTRNLWSPHESAHTMFCGEGCPKSSALLVRLAAHLCGFSVAQVGFPPTEENAAWKAQHFKTQLVDGYINAGLKGQRTIFLLTEDEADETALVYMSDFVVSGSVSYLFTSEQQATIANAMRSEVTSAGLTYSKESAWNFFLQSIQQNFRWILIYSSTGPNFYRKCLEFPALVNALNVYFVPHWSRENLVAHADHYIRHLEMFSKKEKENVCHLLASMHLAIARHDQCQQGRGEYGHITNATFETFVQCFTDLIRKKHHEITGVHELLKKVLTYTESKMKSYATLASDLQQQMVALNEHKQGTLQILVQIAQDKVVVEQKIHSVHQHMKRIKGFQKLLPEYQLAHEKAVYKASAIISDVRRLVKDMDIGALGELRVMQKPDVDTEELMASIIIILKSPNTDLTWSKGAKRQMANIDRFLNELSSFDKIQLSESTLELLEANIKKASFTVENMERKAGGNVAAGTLLKWLQRAVRYYRIKASKVKPLHSKVEEMKVALEEAEQKMKSLQQRKDALIARLKDLETSFEDATVDKSKQEQKTIQISQKLQKAGALIQLLQVESNKYAQIIGSLQDRLSGLPGSTAIAAGFVSYLGAYATLFRQLILTVEWPRALKERGFPLRIDFIDPVKGRVIDFAVQFFWEDPEQSEIPDVLAINGDQEGRENLDTEENELKLEDLVSDPNSTEGPPVAATSFHRNLSLPIISEEHYREYVEALLKVVVKESEIQEWIVRDWTQQQMENAAIVHFSWQRPALLLDPCYEGKTWFDSVQGRSSKLPLTSVSLKTRQDSSILAPIEKAIATGSTLVLHNYSNKWDHLLKPLIDHCCAVTELTTQQGASDILSFNGHRLLCSEQFKLVLVASEDDPQLSAEMSSGTTIINCSPCQESLREVLLHRAFASIQPELHLELQPKTERVTRAILQQQHSLEQLEEMVRECFISSDTDDVDNTDRMTAIFSHKQELSEKLEATRSLRCKLVQLRNQLLPLASRGAVLFSTLKALRPLAAEYQFSLRSFLQLFDKAIGARNLTQDCDIEIEDVKEGFVGPLPPSSNQVDARTQEPFRNDGMKDALSVPSGPELPSPGLQYLSLAANQIIEVMEQLTRTVYQSMTQSLLPEHILLASALLCFQMQQQGKENLFSDDELAFLVHGSSAYGNMTLALADMGSNLSPPSWLPSERWEDLLVLSMAPGPLNSFCIQVAEKSSLWEEWYNTDYPDLQNLPHETTEKEHILEGKEQDEISRQAGNPDQSPFLEFHKLLLLRALRPDRLPAALSQYVKKHMSDLVLNSAFQEIDELSNLAESTLGILVLLQQQNTTSKKDSYEGTVIHLDPTHVICRAAKDRSIPASIVSIKKGCAPELKASLDDMMNQDGWLIIENLQLASKAVLEELHQSMLCAKRMKEPQTEESHFCVWLTTEPGGSLPVHFVTSMKKVSWHIFVSDHIAKMAVLGPLTSYGSPEVLMKVAILSALDQVKDELNVKLKALQMNTRTVCFGVCVLHGILAAQQTLPGTGLNHLLTIGPLQLNQALKEVICCFQKMQTTEEDFLQVLKDAVSMVYTNLATRSEDVSYIQALTEEIISKCQQQTDSLNIGGLTIPVPSVNIDPRQYSIWLSEKFPESCSVGEALLPRRAERAACEAHAARFLQGLADMLDAMQSGFPPANPLRYKAAKEMFRLRRSLGAISEQLPSLLEVETLKADASGHLSPHPGTYADGEGAGDKIKLPETIGYCLLQECYWMNASVYYIRQQVLELSKSLVAGSFAVPEHLSSAARDLQKGDVPTTWLHPHCRPTPHSLLSWLADLQERHNQLKQWLKRGLMPFANGEKEALTAVRPGGLVNPGALFTALRHEYALQHGYLLDEVVLSCQISEYPDYKPQALVYQLYLERLFLQNAMWDFKHNHLIDSRKELFPLPFVTITPAHQMDVKSNEEGIEIYECPLYMDNTKQFCVTKMPLLCKKPVQQWHLKRVAIILNPEPETFFPPKLNNFAHSRTSDRRQHVMTLNTRSLTDRSFYAKLFHPVRESTFYQGAPPIILDQRDETGNIMDTQVTDRISMTDNMGYQAEIPDGNSDLLEDHQNKGIRDSVIFQPPSESEEASETQEDIINEAYFSNQKSHLSTDDTATEEPNKLQTPKNELEARQEITVRSEGNTEYDGETESLADEDQKEILIQKSSDVEGDLLDSSEIDPVDAKDEKEIPIDNQDGQTELLVKYQNKKDSDTLMPPPTASSGTTSDTGADQRDIKKQTSFADQKSYQGTNSKPTGENNQCETSENEFPTQQRVSASGSRNWDSDNKSNTLLDKDPNGVIEQSTSNENADCAEEVAQAVNFGNRNESSADSSDTNKDSDGKASSDGGENDNVRNYVNKVANETELSINSDHESDSEYSDNDDVNNYAVNGHGYENEAPVQTETPYTGDPHSDVELKNSLGDSRSLMKNTLSYDEEGFENDARERDLKDSADNTIQQAMTSSFLGLLNEPEEDSHSDSDDDLDF
ncbi:uncharacterized protein [Ambystoma mexicanum]|uniref:uncharacterized protein n=1 Tax=Ambystoma mexicanum TaxID=8296 RepID=UPI0037E93CB6